jgi:hypothetical protein
MIVGLVSDDSKMPPGMPRAANHFGSSHSIKYNGHIVILLDWQIL